MTTASTPTTGGSKVRVGVQRFGTFLSGMIMPNIPAANTHLPTLMLAERIAGWLAGPRTAGADVHLNAPLTRHGR